MNMDSNVQYIQALYCYNTDPINYITHITVHQFTAAQKNAYKVKPVAWPVVTIQEKVGQQWVAYERTTIEFHSSDI